MNARIRSKSAIVIILFLLLLVLAINHLLASKDKHKVIEFSEQSISDDQLVDDELPTVDGSQEDAGDVWIAGVKASDNVGQYAPVRPHDLDPLLRWMPPVAREKWLDKTAAVLTDRLDRFADLKLTDVYFHLGYKDKPASCGRVSGTQISNQEEVIVDQRFIYTGRSSVMLERELPAIFDQFWQNLCVKRPYE